MPGRQKGIRRSKQSRIDRYYTVTDKDPVTGSLPKEEVKAEEKKEDQI